MRHKTRQMLILFSLVAALFGCGGGGSSNSSSGGSQPTGELKAEVKITALQFAESTIFSVTVKSVTGITDAASFNLIGEETRPDTNLNEIAANFVTGKTTITLEIHNALGTAIAFATLDAADFPTPFEGAVTLSSGSPAPASKISVFQGRSSDASENEITRNKILHMTQIGNLDILASGIIDDLSVGTRSIQVPLNCGPTQPGNISPPANEGFFIINDVMIEFRYGITNIVELNNVLSVKLRESDRSFDNMTLAFRNPGSPDVKRVRPKPFKLLTAAEAAVLIGAVNTAVSAANPWNTAIAFVDLSVTPFGRSKLVETTVTSVIGDCVIAAKSFTVQEGAEIPEPPKAIGDRVDKNTLQPDLILYILGNEVQVRNPTLKTCGRFTRANSAGAEGTIDNWDISAIATGASFDFEFDAFSIPDKFRVEYPVGTELLNTGWRGSSAPPGEILEGPGRFDALNLFTKGAANTVKVIATGNQPSTAWNYKIRCVDPIVPIA